MVTKTYYWVLENTFENVDRETIENQLEKAFNVWSKYILANFFKININLFDKNDTKDVILIGFYSGTHKCEAFDGEDGILAHATFKPYDMKDLKIHFDADEKWNFNINLNSIISNSPLFYNIALHEIGHVLGLDHTSDLNSIMNPKYSRFVDDLFKKDIFKAQTIHGIRKDVSKKSEEPYIFTIIKIYYKEIFFYFILFLISRNFFNKINYK